LSYDCGEVSLAFLVVVNDTSIEVDEGSGRPAIDVAAGEACVRLRSSRKPCERDFPDAPRRL